MQDLFRYFENKLYFCPCVFHGIRLLRLIFGNFVCRETMNFYEKSVCNVFLYNANRLMLKRGACEGFPFSVERGGGCCLKYTIIA